MRFLVAQPGPAFSVHDLFVGWAEALRNAGQTVKEFNLHDRLTFYGTVLMETPEEGVFKRALTGEQAAELAMNGLYASILKTRPHVLLLVSGFFVDEHLLRVTRDAGVTVVLVATESPYEDERQVAIAKHCDLVLVNDPTNLADYKAVTRAEYFCQAYRPNLHHPGLVVPELVCDLGFVGTGYPSRLEFFEQMDLDGLDVLLAGNWRLSDEHSPLRRHLAHDLTDCLDNTDTVDVYRSMKVGINLYRREAAAEHLVDGWAMGPREVEMAACQAFFLRDPRGEGDEVLDMLPTFESPAEASALLRWYLAHDSERESLARKAREAVADRTFDNHAARLLRLLERN